MIEVLSNGGLNQFSKRIGNRPSTLPFFSPLCHNKTELLTMTTDSQTKFFQLSDKKVANNFLSE